MRYGCAESGVLCFQSESRLVLDMVKMSENTGDCPCSRGKYRGLHGRPKCSRSASLRHERPSGDMKSKVQSVLQTDRTRACIPPEQLENSWAVLSCH